MADKAVSELIEAERITATDLFVLEQNGTAKKLTGQVLLNWLTAAADGHGGIQSIAKVSTSGLADTYRITLADTTTFDFVVTNGKGISGITRTATEGLVDTYTINYSDGTSGTFAVTNGEKGDKGDNTYTWIKYASQEPTATSHSFGDVPDNWIGVYFGSADTAPTDWTQYQWFKIKGEKGDTGDPATLNSSSVEYQTGDSGTVIPSGAWSSSVPVVAQGKYLWTRTTQNFNTGEPIVSYSVSRMGIDGAGSVSSVAGISPNVDGNVPLTAENVGALPDTGGDLTGELRMNGQPIRGLNAPTANDQAANMDFVNQQMKKAAPRNLLVNPYFKDSVNQRGKTTYTGAGYGIDGWRTNYAGDTVAITANGVKNTMNSTVDGWHLHQIIDGASLVGKSLTVAAKVKTMTGTGLSFRMSFRDSTDAEISSSSVKCSTGVVVASGKVPTGTVKIRIGVFASAGVAVGNYVELEWAVLYVGTYTVDNLIERPTIDKVVETLKCQEQLYVCQGYTAWAGYKSSTLYAFIDVPAKMRVTPTVTATSIEVRGAGEVGEGAATATISKVEYGSFGNKIRLTLSASGVAEYQPVVIVTNGLMVSAEI